jgi:hypothetical protein
MTSLEPPRDIRDHLDESSLSEAIEEFIIR